MSNKTSFLATALCVLSLSAPSFAQNTTSDTTSGQNTTSGVSGTTASDPNMNTNTGAASDTTARSGMTSDTTSGSYNANTANTTGNTTGVTTDNTASGTMGTTSDTSAARNVDTNTYRSDTTATTATDDRYVQNEEAPGRSPFFYILLALIAFALISYAVKASRRNTHHTTRQL